MGNRPRRNYERQPAHAPYNFVSMVDYPPLECEWFSSEQKVTPHDRYYPDTYTGYFDVTLETITPLFVRGMLTADEVQQKAESRNHPEPFMIDGKPVIPGSSLRGMLHNLVSIITFGKMHFVSDANTIFFRAVAAKRDDPQGQAYKRILGRPNLKVHAGEHVRAGYLVYRDRVWYIQPARGFDRDCPFALVPDKHDVVRGVKGIRHLNSGTYQLGAFDVCYTMGKGNKAQTVYTPDNPADATATLVCTGNMAETQGQDARVRTNRGNFVLVLKATERTLIPIREEIVTAYLDALSPFQKGDNDQSKRYFDERKGMLQPGKPVFYLEEDGEVIHFGHSPNFRIAHITTGMDRKKRAITPRDLVPDALLNPNVLDYTEAMFGYVSDDKAKRKPAAYAGRISVTSATLDAENRMGEPQTNVVYGPEDALKRTPGSPKPTTFQHYLEQPDGVRTEKPDLHHYGTRGAKIRGHKLYWRQDVAMETLKADNTDGSKPNIETTFYPIKPGTCFSFRVYFENLTNAELGALAWALTLGDDDNAYHMIGMGKPYGLGVAKLTARLTGSDRLARYETLFTGNGTWYEGQTNADYRPFIEVFKTVIENHTGQRFDDHDRIQQLKTMLGLQAADPAKFSYMQLGGESGRNEYTDRPVLPWPDEVVE